MVDVAGTELSSEDLEVLGDPLVGSVILFTRNYRNPQQISELCGAIREVRNPPLLIAVDHEGGRVQRFREGFTRLPPVRSLGRRYDEDRRDAQRKAHVLGWLMAAELRAVGVDFSFAPCVDLDYGLSEIIGDRAFHRDPAAVSALATAYMAGMREAGMAAVAKHFPGHGAVGRTRIWRCPSIAGRSWTWSATSRRIGRSSRISFPASWPHTSSIRRSIPCRRACRSAGSTEILRGTLGFHGCVFADDLTMAGVAAFGDPLGSARRALAAGCDVLPICNDRPAVLQVLDGLEADAAPAAAQARLVRMRARGETPVNLSSGAPWREAVAVVQALAAAPPLVLTEGQS